MLRETPKREIKAKLEELALFGTEPHGW